MITQWVFMYYSIPERRLYFRRYIQTPSALVDVWYTVIYTWKTTSAMAHIQQILETLNN